jgi:hypothetical protein
MSSPTRDPGHYEVYYVSLTDGSSGAGAWIRYTMLAPQAGEATCALWFMAMDPRAGRTAAFKQTFPIAALEAASSPFSLRIGEATLDDHGMRGACEGAEWDLRWQPSLPGATHVHPLLERAKIAKTVLTLPPPDRAISGTLTVGGRPLELDGARGGQAHLWGSKHASRWTWAHCNDFRTEAGEPRPGTWFDGVSVFVPRMGADFGPSTPIVGRFHGEDFNSISPARVLANRSRLGLNGWHAEARDGRRRIVVAVEPERETLVGVTYQDPDGEPAYCYNTEVATMRVEVWDRNGSGWQLRESLIADGCAHFEYAQRQPVDELALRI